MLPNGTLCQETYTGGPQKEYLKYKVYIPPPVINISNMNAVEEVEASQEEPSGIH